MIAQKHRIHGLGSLRYVYQRGKTVRSQALAIKFMRNDKRDDYRCAVVVSKKVHKSAVARNRVRRRIFEIIRQNENRITGPYDLVITVFSVDVQNQPPDQLQKTLLNLLAEAGMLS